MRHSLVVSIILRNFFASSCRSVNRKNSEIPGEIHNNDEMNTGILTTHRDGMQKSVVSCSCRDEEQQNIFRTISEYCTYCANTLCAAFFLHAHFHRLSFIWNVNQKQLPEQSTSILNPISLCSIQCFLIRLVIFIIPYNMRFKICISEEQQNIFHTISKYRMHRANTRWAAFFMPAHYHRLCIIWNVNQKQLPAKHGNVKLALASLYSVFFNQVGDFYHPPGNDILNMNYCLLQRIP